MKKLFIITLLFVILLLLSSIAIANWSRELGVGDYIKVPLSRSNYFIIFYRGYINETYVFALPQGYSEDYYYLHTSLDEFKVVYHGKWIKIKVRKSLSHLKVNLNYEIISK